MTASLAPGYGRVVPIDGGVLASPARPLSAILEVGLEVNRDDVVLTLVKDGDHRLSRPEDIERLLAAVAEF